jgi:putative methyltransferase (TIGR04325 family)
MLERLIGYTRGARRPYIWEGVYNDYRDVPANGAGFGSEEWISNTRERTRRALELFGSPPSGIPYDIPSYHSLFSLTVALLTQYQERVRVLDFGGGMGLALANLLRSLGETGPKPQVEYLVIDNERSCQDGILLFDQVRFVQFSATLPQDPGPIDIILLSSVLQFVEDYKNILKELATFKPRYWLFTFLPAGDIPTFASGQKNVRGSTIPVWFFNLGEIIDIMMSLGYRLIFKAPLEREFDMSNFPPTHRLPQQCNLLFHLKSDADKQSLNK